MLAFADTHELDNNFLFHQQVMAAMPAPAAMPVATESTLGYGATLGLGEPIVSWSGPKGGPLLGHAALG